METKAISPQGPAEDVEKASPNGGPLLSTNETEMKHGFPQNLLVIGLTSFQADFSFPAEDEDKNTKQRLKKA